MRESQSIRVLPNASEVLSLADTARIAERSLSWARAQRACGVLVPAELDGKPAVKADSLFRLIAARRPRVAAPARQLRLVVDNTR